MGRHREKWQMTLEYTDAGISEFMTDPVPSTGRGYGPPRSGPGLVRTPRYGSNTAGIIGTRVPAYTKSTAPTAGGASSPGSRTMPTSSCPRIIRQPTYAPDGRWRMM